MLSTKQKKMVIFLSFTLVIYVAASFVQNHTRGPISTRSEVQALVYTQSRSISQPVTEHYDYNWTILLTVNEGFRDFFSNWWWNFQRLGINAPIIIVTEDDVAYAKLQEEFQIRSNYSVTVLRSDTVSVSKAATHGTKEYKQIVSARPKYILEHLQAGLNVVYTDIDTVWLKDPFPYFNGRYDMWIEQEYGHIYCTGFMAIKSNNKTIKLVRDWKQALLKSPQLNQPTFNRLLKASSVKFKPLNETIFPHGPDFNTFNEQRRSHVVLMHNTFVYGHDKKLERFKKLNLWYKT